MPDQHSGQLRGRIIAGLRYECDAISLAIGEGCGECLGCVAYAATNNLFEQYEALGRQHESRGHRLNQVTAERDALQEQLESALATIEVLEDKEALSDIIASQTEELANIEKQYEALRNFNAATRAAHETLTSSGVGVGAVSPSGSSAPDPAIEPCLCEKHCGDGCPPWPGKSNPASEPDVSERDGSESGRSLETGQDDPVASRSETSAPASKPGEA